MEIILKNHFIVNRFLITLIIISFISSKENIKEANNLIENYNSFYESYIINIELDKYISGNITDDSINYYNISFLNDSEQIIFDYQSQYGCLYIFIKQNNTLNSSQYDFLFCSEGIDSIFSLNKTDILEKIDDKERDTIKDLNIIIGVGYSNSEIIKNNYIYSLKVSLRKPNINIFEINSEHKLLCKTEKINGTNKCLFVITYNDNKEENKDDKNIIIYPLPQIKYIKLNIYADFIDKENYDKWNKDYLINNIPNNLSNYSNYLLEQDFIYIPLNKSNKYIYICIESNKETTIEMITQILYKNEEIKLPKINEMKIYSINISSIYLDFNSLENKDIFITLVTLNGKASIYWENDNSNQYITDIRENKLLLNCDNLSRNNCKLIINNLEYNEQNNENELGYIFYIIYTQKTDNILNEFLYNKSIKLCYNNIKFPILLYSQIPNIDSPININLQFYNISEYIFSIYSNIFNIEIVLLSTQDIYQIKKDPSSISLVDSIKGNIDSSLLASNINLSIEDMDKFKIKENPWIFIYISNKDLTLEKLILGSTISQKDSLIYPSERIYHYGQLNKEEKVIYKLGGKAKYHLMRLEIGINSYNIGWSVKRTIEESNYIYNDTDLSFVTEKWYNGRSLITMYIERGEDIYLTIFNKNQTSNNLTSYIFKYINSAKNSDFRNYYIKNDILSYNKNYKTINVNPINNIPNSYINYYLKIIEKDNYIKNELIKTISIIQSNSTLSKKGIINNKQISFSLDDELMENNSYYINVYSHIIGNDLDIEYISYNGLFINLEPSEQKEIIPSNKILIIISIIIGGFCLIVIIIRCCCVMVKKNRRLENLINQVDINDSLLFSEI